MTKTCDSTIDWKEALGEWFSENTNYHLVTDQLSIADWKSAQSSPTWGAGPLGDTGYYQLAVFSPLKKGEKGIVFISKEN